MGKTRRIVHVGVTTSPTDEWTAQQLREATPWGECPKYLLHDRDSKYGSHFSAVAVGSDIKELRTPYRAPRANGVLKDSWVVCEENAWTIHLFFMVGI